MSSKHRSVIAYYVLLVGVLAVVSIVSLLLCTVVTLAADWLLTRAVPSILSWSRANPNARDVLTIGTLAFVALLLAEWRRKPTR